MYNLTDGQIAEFDSFVSKIPTSIVRSEIERIWDVAKSDKRFTPEQFEKIVSFSPKLPLELQSYPLSYLHYIKNNERTEGLEKANDTAKKGKANLVDDVAAIHEDVKVKHKDTEDKSVSPEIDNGNKSAKKQSKKKLENKVGIDKELDKQEAAEIRKPVREGAKLNPQTPAKKEAPAKKALAPTKLISKKGGKLHVNNTKKK